MKINKEKLSNSANNSGTISFLNIILAVFVALKFAGVINWSWWLVLVPLWIELGLILLIILIILIIVALDRKDYL